VGPDWGGKRGWHARRLRLVSKRRRHDRRGVISLSRSKGAAMSYHYTALEEAPANRPFSLSPTGGGRGAARHLLQPRTGHVARSAGSGRGPRSAGRRPRPARVACLTAPSGLATLRPMDGPSEIGCSEGRLRPHALVPKITPLVAGGLRIKPPASLDLLRMRQARGFCHKVSLAP
jgi:hypothetical protein